jgi:predicted secreted protein
MASEKKSGSGNRREFVRTRVPLAERVASVVIMGLLAGIGIAIGIKGKHFNPDIFAVRTDSLKSTSAAVEGKAGTAPSTPGSTAENPAATEVSKSISEKPAVVADASAEGGAEGSGDAPKPAVKGEPLEIALPGIKPMSDTEFYNSDNLFEKIDGRAPAYQNFNVQALRCRSFNVVAAAGSFVDVYEYRFDSPVDAFGMFALERDPKGGSLDFAPDGYSGDMGYFFRQGAVYVQIIASDVKPETLAAAKAIALNRAKELPVDDSGLAGRRKLPAAGMIADSVSFVPENAQGQATLKDVFQAKYSFDGTELPFFIMVTTPDDAAKAWKSFQDFCARFGKVENLPDVSGAKIFSAQVFGKWKIIYQRDGELGGVFDVADEATAQTFVEKYLRGEIK